MRSSLALLDDEDKGVHLVDTNRGKREMVTVYEVGLYQLIMTSRKQEAKAFKKWMCGEVLPSIRKFGTYPPPAGAEIPKQPPLKPWGERISETWGPHMRYVRTKLPGMFTVATEIGMQVMMMEDILHAHNMLTRGSDRPDISVGLRWNKHRLSLGWHEPKFRAPLRLNEQNTEVMVNVYPHIELKEFHRWFSHVYMPSNYICYLDGKNEFKPIEPLARASAADNASLKIAGEHAQLDDGRQKQLAEHSGFYKSPHIIPVTPKEPKRIAKRSPRRGKR